MVKAQHCREALGRERGRRLHGDPGVGVAGVAHDEHLDVAACDGVKRLALDGEDFAVGAQQLRALHALGAGTGAHEERSLRVLEGHHRIARGDHVREKREGAVGKLHHHALEAIHALGRVALEHLKDDGLIGAEQIACGDAKEQGVSDMAGRAGHGHANGTFHLYYLLGRCTALSGACRSSLSDESDVEV